MDPEEVFVQKGKKNKETKIRMGEADLRTVPFLL